MASPASTSPVSTSTSTSNSSASLLLDLLDELWFSHSVVPFPSFSLPCLPLFPSLFSNSPDPSTLLAQLMFSTTHSHSPASLLPLPSSTSPPKYSPWDLPAYIHAYPEPSHEEDEDAYHGYPACSCGKDEGKDAYLMHSYGKIKDAYFAPGHGEGGDIYRSACYGTDENEYAVPRYGKAKDAHPPGNDGVNSENAIMIVEKQDIAVEAALADVPSTLNAEDALSGIHDVGALLRDQHHQGKEGMQHYKWRQDMLDVVLPESWPRATTRWKRRQKCGKC